MTQNLKITHTNTPNNLLSYLTTHELCQVTVRHVNIPVLICVRLVWLFFTIMKQIKIYMFNIYKCIYGYHIECCRVIYDILISSPHLLLSTRCFTMGSYVQPKSTALQVASITWNHAAPLPGHWQARDMDPRAKTSTFYLSYFQKYIRHRGLALRK